MPMRTLPAPVTSESGSGRTWTDGMPGLWCGVDGVCAFVMRQLAATVRQISGLMASSFGADDGARLDHGVRPFTCLGSRDIMTKYSVGSPARGSSDRPRRSETDHLCGLLR